MDLKAKVLGFIRSQGLIKPGSTVILAVSGGADSVALASLMHELRHELSLSLCIAHFNHRLRAGADRDQKIVEKLGARMTIPVVAEARKGRAQPQTVSEDRARQMRLDFFGRLQRRLKADCVALAHTQNDVAETVLMRLLRGSGLYGLRAILPQRDIDGIRIVRPLIEVTRPQIESYVRRKKLKYGTDKTNSETRFLRNKVRLKLLPYLAKQFNPQITGVLAGLAKTTAEDYDFLQQALGQRIKENVVSSKRTVKMGLDFFIRQPAAMRRLALRWAFEQLTGDLKQLTFLHIGQAENLAARPVGTVVHWPQQVRAVRQKKFIEFIVCDVKS